MPQEGLNLLRKIAVSKYVHLSAGLLVLYGLSLAVTYTTPSEKILDYLLRYCYADYSARSSKASRKTMEWEYYRERYEERLSILTRDLFDYRDRNQLQAYLSPEELVYDVWQEKDGPSYLLAPLVAKGHYRGEVPEKVAFDYCILGDKWIVPWQKYKAGQAAMIFVSAVNNNTYIHKDSLDYIVRDYFEALWASDARDPPDFCWDGWDLTYSLSRDLQDICENVFIYGHYRSEEFAQEYFVEEGFNVFLPTMLAMAARMVVDVNSPFSVEDKYQRVYLTGLYLEPNYTLLSLLEEQSAHNPSAKKLYEEFGKRLDMKNLDRITLDEISEVAGEIFEELEDSHTR